MKNLKQPILTALTLFLINNICTEKLTFNLDRNSINKVEYFPSIQNDFSYENELKTLNGKVDPAYIYLKLAVTTDPSQTGISLEKRDSILDSKKEVFYRTIERLTDKRLVNMPAYVEGKTKKVSLCLREIFDFINRKDNKQDFETLFDEKKLDQFEKWHKEVKKIEDPKFPELKNSNVYVHMPITFEETSKSMGELYMNKKGENWGSITKGKKWGSIFKGNLLKSYRLEDPRIISTFFPDNIYKGIAVGVGLQPVGFYTFNKQLITTITKHGKGTKIDDDIFEEKFKLREDEDETSIKELMDYILKTDEDSDNPGLDSHKNGYYQLELSKDEEDSIPFDTIFPEFKRIKKYLNNPKELLNDNPYLARSINDDEYVKESIEYLIKRPLYASIPIVAGEDDWHIFPVIVEEGLDDKLIKALQSEVKAEIQKSEIQTLANTKTQALNVKKITMSTKALEGPEANLFFDSKNNSLSLTHESTKKDGQELVGQFNVLTKTETDYTFQSK